MRGGDGKEGIYIASGESEEVLSIKHTFTFSWAQAAAPVRCPMRMTLCTTTSPCPKDFIGPHCVALIPVHCPDLNVGK